MTGLPMYQSLAPEQFSLTDEEFALVGKLLHVRSGIILGDHKRELAARMIGLRVRKMGLSSATEYLKRLQQDPQSEEWDAFVNVFTINHTAFFRERHHFGILADFIRTRSNPVHVWCCAASTGEEAYTIAITLLENTVAKEPKPWVWATDIDTQAIEKARKGIYTLERVQPVPEPLLKKYFYRGKGSKSGLVRVKPVLQEIVEFEPLNLVAPSWPSNQKFDAIFCRNTMIYFDKPTQTRILERFAPMLKPGGLLFAGHSENFTYLTKAFRLRGQTVYALA
ncbi:MAG TPA: CheR family methyltransferase [Pusillimonas sp.]|uniref:CheR family methyltransferase n=1 Tax=unclassified Pusillimonas TaxID=2640016 RepID=UPI002637380E|nr:MULTISPECIES: CheR family methyltransferase [unclassified Pusillimonas]HLU19151.1 CheR family methyltransferase [Pusillimonas sp.]